MILRHAPGLAVSPPSRDNLRVARSGYSPRPRPPRWVLLNSSPTWLPITSTDVGDAPLARKRCLLYEGGFAMPKRQSAW